MSLQDDDHMPMIPNTAPITLCLFTYESDHPLHVEWYAVLGWRDFGLGVVPVTASVMVNEVVNDSVQRSASNLTYCLEQRLVGQAPVYLFPTSDNQYTFDDACAYATQRLRSMNQ